MTKGPLEYSGGRREVARGRNHRHRRPPLLPDPKERADNLDADLSPGSISLAVDEEQNLADSILLRGDYVDAAVSSLRCELYGVPEIFQDGRYQFFKPARVEFVHPLRMFV